jgi:predicted alpha/beta-fold hydrolase
MPVLISSFDSFVKNGHLHTILPNLLRRVILRKPRQEEIETPDDDFLELDWYDLPESNKLVILSHGLEGNSRRRYMKGMAKHLLENGYNVLAWNYRSCGSKINNQLRFYHSGDTEDLDTIIRYALSKHIYASIYLIGFSMGGNISLKYLGEKGEELDPKIKAAVTFSVPLDLIGSSRLLSKWWNRFYMRRFLKSLRKKVEAKAPKYPEMLNLESFDTIKSFKGFDNQFTAPIHGFRDAFDYWKKSSSLHYLENIKIPVLIVNAQNDSFLSPSCFPFELAEKSALIHFEAPHSGGHVGFWSLDSVFWTEKRAVEFLGSY